jgi:hypothetical protein
MDYTIPEDWRQVGEFEFNFFAAVTPSARILILIAPGLRMEAKKYHPYIEPNGENPLSIWFPRLGNPKNPSMPINPLILRFRLSLGYLGQICLGALFTQSGEQVSIK